MKHNIYHRTYVQIVGRHLENVYSLGKITPGYPTMASNIRTRPLQKERSYVVGPNLGYLALEERRNLIGQFLVMQIEGSHVIFHSWLRGGTWLAAHNQKSPRPTGRRERQRGLWWALYLPALTFYTHLCPYTRVRKVFFSKKFCPMSGTISHSDHNPAYFPTKVCNNLNSLTTPTSLYIST